ncbi:adenylosuccinate synthetase [Streptococcus pneumoniae]|nr:adenylosuccinate synthetase [Streptococcus pneumoniae]
MKGVDNLFFIFEEGFKDSLKNRMNLLKIVLDKFEKFLRFLILKVKQQELIELIVMFQVL